MLTWRRVGSGDTHQNYLKDQSLLPKIRNRTRENSYKLHQRRFRLDKYLKKKIGGKSCQELEEAVQGTDGIITPTHPCVDLDLGTSGGHDSVWLSIGLYGLKGLL